MITCLKGNLNGERIVNVEDLLLCVKKWIVAVYVASAVMLQYSNVVI